MARVPPLAAILVLVGTTVGVQSAVAQTLTGRVLEEGRETPIPGAVVALVDREGARRAMTTADSIGRFKLSPPEPGQYAVTASREGYRATRSPLFALKATGTSTFDILLSPERRDRAHPLDLAQHFGLGVALLAERFDLLVVEPNLTRQRLDRLQDRLQASPHSFLDGAPISTVEAQHIDPDHLEAIAVLTPVEESTFYGTGAGGGLVLMWTRAGTR